MRPANLAALLALCDVGDVTMGMSLPAGGHLTHGWKVSATGIYYKSVQYGVRKSDHRIDMDEVRDLAKEHRPRLIWVGHSAYPRVLDFPAFASVAEEVGAHLVADIAHVAGLVAGIGTPQIRNGKRAGLSEWPKSLGAIAAKLGSLAAETQHGD